MLKCEYCSSKINEADANCRNCGAPVMSDDCKHSDFRTCPFCNRRLLALGSPACNYCGRRLPEQYIQARSGDLRRLTEVEEKEEVSEVGRKVDELIRQTAQRKSAKSLVLGLDLTSLIDLFR